MVNKPEITIEKRKIGENHPPLVIAEIGINHEGNIKKAKQIFIMSLPLLLSGLVSSIYLRIDQIMVKEILSLEAVGVYSAACRFVVIWFFIPIVFGIILIIGALSGDGFLWLPFILGLAGLAKGVYFFVASPDQAKMIMEWWFFKASPETIRFLGLISFVLGMALLR